MQSAINRYLAAHGFEKYDLKTVFFDMDGTLFNSMPRHAAAWTKAMHDFGVEFNEIDAFLHEGRTGNAIVDLFMPQAKDWSDEEKRAVYLKKTEYFLAMGNVEPVDNVPNLLELIKKLGLERYVVTGSGTKTLFNRLDTYFPNVFDLKKMVTAFDVKHGKPNPEPYLKGLEKANVKPWQGMVVENAPLGVRSAVEANIFTVAINTGPIPKQSLIDEGADLVFDNMQQFIDCWNNYLQQ